VSDVATNTAQCTSSAKRHTKEPIESNGVWSTCAQSNTAAALEAALGVKESSKGIASYFRSVCAIRATGTGKWGHFVYKKANYMK
jgi:hypothetical protein